MRSHQGTIVIVNGASSAGKTSLLREFQELAETPFLDIGLDKFIFSLPKRYLGLHWPEVLGRADQSGPMGHRLVHGMHNALAALSDSGINVIADHVLVERAWVRECAATFADRRAYIVGIRCPLAILEAREIARKDRTLGQAKKQYEKVHEDLIYDLELDSSTLTAVECAGATLDHISRNEPCAFAALKESYS